MKRITHHVHRLVQLLKLDSIISYLATAIPLLKKFIPLSQEYPSNEIRTVKRNGVTFKLDISDYMQWALFAGVPDFSWKYAFENKSVGDIVILDIGANVGHFCLKVAKGLLKEKVSFQVHAFEPNPAVFGSLLSNLQLNGDLKNVLFPHDLAIGNKEGDVSFTFSKKNTGGGRVNEESGNSFEKVRMVKLDEWVRENKITNVTFIKIDVEGYEPEVLLGAAETIKRFKPHIYLEITNEWFKMKGYSSEWVFRLILDWGYQFWVDNEGTPVECRNEYLESTIHQFNIIAKPVTPRF